VIYITVNKYGTITKVGKKKIGESIDIGEDILVDLSNDILKQLFMLALK